MITCMISLVLLTGLFPQIALADSYTSTTMRLLHYEGTVEIEDASGKPRAVMENVRFSSGESMKTAAASSASVGLDEGRIVTLNEKSRIEFKKQDAAVSMNLTEGKIFLDVSEKLEANETMDITTATMAIGIRGTIVYVSSEPVTDATSAGMESVDLEGLAPEKGHIVSISQIGVLEGTAQITYTDNSNRQQSVAVEAGKKATVPEYSEDAEGIPEPAVSELTKEDIEGFVLSQVTGNASIINRVQEACDVADDIDLSSLAGIYTADGDWTWDSPVTTVTGSITNVGIKSNTCMVEWKGVNPNNYELKQELGTLTVKPVEIVLIQDCAFGVAGNVTIESYGLKVQVSDVDLSYYDVTQMGENRWWIQFTWGDKIEAQIVVVTGETSFEAAATDSATIEAAPAPVGSDPDVIDAAPAESAPAELSREEDQADEDALEEPTEDEIEQARLPEEEPQEEPSEEEPLC